MKKDYSYRKIDNYFEEAVRSKHANDSAAEIRKRSEYSLIGHCFFAYYGL